jgi:hypothetical protein
MESIMSRMSDLHLTIQEELLNGDLMPVEIAERYNVPLSWVESMVISMALKAARLIELCEFRV